jgi:hypothetical protein
LPTAIDRFDSLEFNWDIVNEDLGVEPTWDTEAYYPVGHGIVKTHQDNKLSINVPDAESYQSAYLKVVPANSIPSAYTLEFKTVFRALPEELAYDLSVPRAEWVRIYFFDEIYRMSLMISRTNIGIARDSQYYAMGFAFTDYNTYDIVQEYNKEYIWRITMDRGAPTATSPVQTIYRNGLLVTAFTGDNDYHPVAAHKAWVIQAIGTNYEIDFDVEYFKIAEGIWKPLNRQDDISTAITRHDTLSSAITRFDEEV